MRKTIILVTLMLVFSNLLYVKAESIECKYPDIGLTMTWDTEKEFNVSSNPFVSMKGINSSQSYDRKWLLWKSGKKVNLTEESNIDQNLYKEILNNYGCNDNMRVCIYTEVSVDGLFTDLSTDAIQALFLWDWDQFDIGQNTQSLVIMTESEYQKSNYSMYEVGDIYIYNGDKIIKRWSEVDDFWSGTGAVFGTIWDFLDSTLGFEEDSSVFAYKETSCVTANYDGPYIGININCGTLKNSALEYTKVINDYLKCDDDASCKSKSISNINQKEDVIKNYCSQILQNYSYGVEGQTECINDCLEIKETLNELKSGTDLYDDGSNRGECGFSARLLVWISNILRWIKYILPVIVIVMGILDFIKAIAAGKDDELKKAQGSFTKRLIAAALVFLIPLIVEFVLDKMGFGYDTCGLF